MLLHFLLISIQVTNICAQIYDEDIELSYPAQVRYQNPVLKKNLVYLGKFNNCSCFGLSGTYISCHDMECKTFPTNLNITTAYSFKLKLTSIVTINKEDLRVLKDIVSLEIEANVKLTYFETGCFKCMSKVQNLSISNNPMLTYLQPGVFEGLVNLRLVYLQKNGFLSVSDVTGALTVEFLPKIYLLDMAENTFREIQANDFQPMNNSPLKELNMFLCEIECMHPDFLKPLKNLTDLRLGQNLFNITTITRLIENSIENKIPLGFLSLYDGGFRKSTPHQLLKAIGRTRIRKLNLAKNHFDMIDDKSFPNMPYILNLDLRDCLIVDISPDAFKKLPNLQLLQLGENKLLSIPKAVTIKTLSFLNLAGNSNDGFGIVYFTIPDNIFTNMSSLINLQLSYNRIGGLTQQSFHGLKNLKQLNLKNTSLQYIEKGSFQTVPNLIQLNLINNPFPLFMNLTPDLFKGLNNLRALLLGGCFIRNLTQNPSLFVHMSNLTYLGLERNGLLTIAPNQLIHLKKLISLNLAENRINSWSKSILPHWNLKFFYIQQNKITHITNAMIEDLLMTQSIYLDGNPLICDCTLFPGDVWEIMETYRYKWTEPKEVVAYCLGPEEWRRKSILDYWNYLKQNPDRCTQMSTKFQMEITIISTIMLIIFIIFFTVKLYRFRLRKTNNT